MTAPTLVRVRVLPARTLSLLTGESSSAHHIAGDELELPATEAAQLVADGYVEETKPKPTK